MASDTEKIRAAAKWASLRKSVNDLDRCLIRNWIAALSEAPEAA